MPQFDAMPNQADGLRRIAQPAPVRVIAVTSGKGGVGKTNVSVNLALGLTLAGRSTLLLDADLGLANVDVLLGLSPRANLSHVLDGHCSLEEVVLEGPGGLKIVPAASGVQRMAELGSLAHAGLIRAFGELAFPVDALVVDTAAGLSHGVVSFCSAAQEVIVVVCDEPASITDAYAVVKVLARDHGVHRFRVLANMTRNAQEGQHLFEKLARVTHRFLDCTLEYAGFVPHDEYLRRAVQKQRAVLDLYPRARSSVALRQLAERADTWPLPVCPRGHLEFFLERLVQPAQLKVAAG